MHKPSQKVVKILSFGILLANCQARVRVRSRSDPGQVQQVQLKAQRPGPGLYIKFGLSPTHQYFNFNLNCVLHSVHVVHKYHVFN